MAHSPRHGRRPARPLAGVVRTRFPHRVYSVLAMNVASAAGFLSYEFETEILLSENASVFSHSLDPKRS
jgi:hypothetical protein